jgi:hypothetical protein
MNGFYIEITNKLLEPKHYRNMEESIWLFMWLLDKITVITEEGTGKVLGGKPIVYEDIFKDLGIPRRKYERWVARLRDYKYIVTTRTPKGLSFEIKKAKKSWGKGVDKSVGKLGKACGKKKSDVPKMAERCAKNGTSIYIDIDNSKDNYNYYYKGMPARRDNFTKKWKILDHGEWLEFAGKEKEIIKSNR